MKKIAALTLPLLLAACAQVADLDRTLYDAAGAVSSKDTVTGQRTLNLTDRKGQIEQGNKYAQQVIETYKKKGPMNEALDPVAYQRLANIFVRIHQVSHVSEEPWAIYLLPDNNFNAFVTGGSVIFVNKGLMDQVKSDDEIAAVLGHELAHVTANHLFERQGYSMAAAVTRSKTSATDSFQAGFSTNQEAEADRIGLLYSALAGYDPYAATRIWDRMYRSGGNYGAHLHSHPMNSERSQHTKQVADQVAGYYTPSQVNPNHAALLKKNALWDSTSTLGGNVEAGKGGGLAAVLETAATAYGQKLNAKAEAQKQEQRVALVKYVRSKLQVVKGGAEPPHGYGFVLQYLGEPVLKKLIMKSDAVIAMVDGPIKPDQQFEVHFTNEKLDTTNLDIRSVKLSVDDAEVY